MELLVTLKDLSLLNRIKKSYADGIIFGSAFSAKYSFDLDDLRQIARTCEIEGLKKYISIDSLILENELGSLYRYFEIIKELKVDGIYFADLGVIPAARAYGLLDKLIYDPITLLTNTLDINFYLSQGLGTVLARELTYEEVSKILEKFPGKIDMQVFGHLRMSYSKRKFLSNYFKQLGIEKDINDKNDLTLVEETREYRLPIRESKYGTEIYSDYCLLMYDEFIDLKKYIGRAIVDSDFIDNNETIIHVLKDLRKVSKENVEFLKSQFLEKNPDMVFDTGYLYRKTTDKKEEDE